MKIPSICLGTTEFCSDAESLLTVDFTSMSYTCGDMILSTVTQSLSLGSPGEKRKFRVKEMKSPG